MSRKHSFDPRCLEMAKYFYPDVDEESLNCLAQDIQDAVERFEPERDKVLWEFYQTCERPTATQILEWTTRYPRFADDIRAHAAIRLDIAPDIEAKSDE